MDTNWFMISHPGINESDRPENSSPDDKIPRQPIWLRLITIFFSKKILHPAFKYGVISWIMCTYYRPIGLSLLFLALCMDYSCHTGNMLLALRSLYQRNLWPRMIHPITPSFVKNHHIRLHAKLYVHATIYCGKPQNLELQKREFRTTQRLCIPPILAFLLRPVLRISSLLLGRSIKKWWTRKSEKEKKEYKSWFRERSHVFLGCFGIYGLILLIYYITHLKPDPLTKRSRFVIFNKEQEVVLGQMIYKLQMDAYKDSIVSETHPAYQRLQRVLQKILAGNKDVKSMGEIPWTMTVINTPLTDSFILPGGHIFVTLDILKIAENDDQLGIILAHEMAHLLLLHTLGGLSNEILIDLFLVVPILLLWALFPDIMAAIIQLIAGRLIIVMHSLPYSRNLETEADEIGTKLAAKACIDVREAVVFWATLRVLTEMNFLPPEPWISSHPSHIDREKNLNKAMAKALELRKKAGCSALSETDPRVEFYKRSSEELEAYFKKKKIIE